MKLYSLIALYLAYIVLIVLGLWGWVVNIIWIIQNMGNELTTEMVIRLIGVPVAFLGALAGWFG